MNKGTEYDKFLQLFGSESDSDKSWGRGWDSCYDAVLKILIDNIHEYKTSRGGGDYIHIAALKEIEKLKG